MYDSGDEAETFQSVGVRVRECLVSVVGETRDDDLVPDGQTPPKASDFKGWTDLLVNRLAAGESAARPRSYLKKKLAVETWEYVQLAHPREERGAHGRRDRAQGRRAPARHVHRSDAPARKGTESM